MRTWNIWNVFQKCSYISCFDKKLIIASFSLTWVPNQAPNFLTNPNYRRVITFLLKFTFLVNWWVVEVEDKQQQYSSKSVPSITKMKYIAIDSLLILGHIEEEVNQLSENAIKAKLPDKLQCMVTHVSNKSN